MTAVEVLRGVLVGLAFAELVFVVGFVLSEAVTLVLLRWATNLDRRAQALSDKHYVARFAVPMVTAGCGVGVAVGVNLITSDGDYNALGGLVLTFGSLIVFGYALLGFASGTMPRPHFRPRVRRRLAEARERFSTGVPLSRAEAAPLQRRLRRVERLGARLSEQAATIGWRTALRSERAWLVAVAAAAFVLPIAALVSAVAVAGRGVFDPERLQALGLLAALSMATAAGVVMRRTRKRWELRDLGEELRSGSVALQERLAELTEPEPPPDPPARPGLLARFWKGFRRRSG